MRTLCMFLCGAMRLHLYAGILCPGCVREAPGTHWSGQKKTCFENFFTLAVCFFKKKVDNFKNMTFSNLDLNEYKQHINFYF